MVKSALWRLWASLSSNVEFAAVTVVNHQQHVNFASSDTRTGRTLAGCRASYTPEKPQANVYLPASTVRFRGGQAWKRLRRAENLRQGMDSNGDGPVAANPRRANAGRNIRRACANRCARSVPQR